MVFVFVVFGPKSKFAQSLFEFELLVWDGVVDVFLEVSNGKLKSKGLSDERFTWMMGIDLFIIFFLS